MLIITGTVTARTQREFRSLKLSELSEQAYFAAEAGFNRARAELIKCDGNPLNIPNKFGDLTAPGTAPASYTFTVVEITPGSKSYLVTSEGTAGSGKLTSKRVVVGEITFKSKFPNPASCARQVVQTTYR